MPEMRKYTGGCHCGRVRFAVETELKPVITCNCSICAKRGSLFTFVMPGAVEPVAGGDEDLTPYEFNNHVITHMFCPVCGILPYAKGTRPDGQKMVAINVRALEGVDLDALEMTPFDGRGI